MNQSVLPMKKRTEWPPEWKKETKNVLNDATLISSYESMSSLCLYGREKIKKRTIYLLSPHISRSKYKAVYGPTHKEREKERRCRIKNHLHVVLHRPRSAGIISRLKNTVG
jgi:hypothetical protein